MMIFKKIITNNSKISLSTILLCGLSSQTKASSNVANKSASQLKFIEYIFSFLIIGLLSIGNTQIVYAAEKEGVVERTPKAAKVIDSFGRQTPRSTVRGFILALAENDSTLASSYISMDASDNPVVLVRQIKLALDKGGRFNNDLQISNEPEGDLSDKLPQALEKVGVITVNEQIIDIFLVRQSDKRGNQYWQIAPETVKAIKASEISTQPTLIDKYTLDVLKGKTVWGYNFADLLAVFILAIFCLIFAYIVVGLFYLFFKHYYKKLRRKPIPIDAKVILPLAFIVTSLILSEVMVFSGVSLIVREPVSRIKDIVAWLALTWLLLRVIDAIFNRAERDSYRHNRTERVSILSLIRKIVKALLLVLATIFIFGNLGFDLTTGIAALGVGGLALALGAQKLIENLVGSVVVVADQPVRVGDYCKFGELEGTVIDIGIRSTRFRTMNRTIVTVPNGQFSAMSIENYASRDMYYFNHFIYIKRNIDAQTLQNFLHDINNFIVNHQYSNEEWNQVRIAELRQDCIVIEFRSYIYAAKTAEFYDKQSQLIIDLLAEIEKYPVEHALPTTQVVVEHSDAELVHK